MFYFLLGKESGPPVRAVILHLEIEVLRFEELTFENFDLHINPNLVEFHVMVLIVFTKPFGHSFSIKCHFLSSVLKTRYTI